MARELYSVEEVAEQLGLHVRTIRNYVRDGRLKAARIGKQYRIAREDLEAFTGTSAAVFDPRAKSRHVEVSAIVHIESVDRTLADRISTHVMGSLNRDLGRLRVETAYDPDRGTLKVIVLGDPEIAADLLRLISLLAES
jgi:excisionase family DNA binding protein